MAVDYKEISKSLRTFAAVAVREEMKDGTVDGMGTKIPMEADGWAVTVDRAIISSLALAWADAVRDGLQNMVADFPDLVMDLEVAKHLLAQNNSIDFICMPPGMKAMVASVDQKEVILFEPNMVYAMPLSAVYLNNVRKVMDAFEAVNSVKQAEKANDEVKS